MNDPHPGGLLTAAAVERYAHVVAESRILAELKDYVGLGEAEEALLARVGPALEPYFGVIVDSFYEAILSNSTTASVFTGEAQVARQKRSLLKWMVGVFEGVYDEDYFRLRARIGRTHVRVGLEQRFMMGAMNIVRRGFHDALVQAREELPFQAAEDQAALVSDAHRAIDCICDIELAIMLETYREDYILRRTAESETMAAMGRLTAGLAHEVRNPLNAAKLQLELLKRSTRKVELAAVRDKLDQRREIVASELTRLAGLLDDFLSLARPRQVDPVPLKLAGLLEEVRELQEPLFEAIGCELHLDVDPGLSVLADRARIKQVVVNLLQNAVEALEGCDSPTLAIQVATTASDFVAVCVVDNGPGVAADVVSRALEPFVTTKEAGTGLGLTIVRAIVERHGGEFTLGVRDDGRPGTQARFTLPRG